MVPEPADGRKREAGRGVREDEREVPLRGFEEPRALGPEPIRERIRGGSRDYREGRAGKLELAIKLSEAGCSRIRESGREIDLGDYGVRQTLPPGPLSPVPGVGPIVSPRRSPCRVNSGRDQGSFPPVRVAGSSGGAGCGAALRGPRVIESISWKYEP